MESQFTTAKRLLSQAQEVRAGLGDHGDAFEEALVSGRAPDELATQVTQIVTGLRSALNCVARELAARSGACDDVSELVFPVAPLGLTKSHFPSLLRQLAPAGAELPPRDRETLELPQWFADGGKPWLLELDAVANAACVELRVVRVAASLTQAARRDGGQEYQLKLAPKIRRGSVLLLQETPNGQTPLEAVTVVVASNGKELLTFLDDCILGVSSVLASTGV